MTRASGWNVGKNCFLLIWELPSSIILEPAENHNLQCLNSLLIVGIKIKVIIIITPEHWVSSSVGTRYKDTVSSNYYEDKFWWHLDQML